jgi:hypothetical protein
MAVESIHTNVALRADGQDGGKVLGVGPSLLKLNLGVVLHRVGIGEDTAAAKDKPTAAGTVLPLALPRQRKIGLRVHAEHLHHSVHARHHSHHLHHRHHVATISHRLHLPTTGRGHGTRCISVGGGFVAAQLAAAAAADGGNGVGSGGRRGGGAVGRGGGRLGLAAALALVALGGRGGVVHGGGLGFRDGGSGPSRGRD